MATLKIAPVAPHRPPRRRVPAVRQLSPTTKALKREAANVAQGPTCPWGTAGLQAEVGLGASPCARGISPPPPRSEPHPRGITPTPSHAHTSRLQWGPKA